MKFIPEGIITALITPFDKDERIDEKALRKLIDYQIKAGVDGIFVGGTTGESHALDFEEKREILRIAIDEVKKRIKVYAGAGGTTTLHAIRVAQMAEEEGADAVSVITPYFITPNQAELYNFFKDIAQSTSLPITMYNHPLKTTINISADTIKKLAEIPNIVGIKDSSANLNNNMSYVQAGGKDFSVLSGNDSMILSLLQLGGRGAIAASANFAPELSCGIYREFKAGNMEKAKELQFKLFRIRGVFTLGTYPAMIKEACLLRGLDMGKCRRPLDRLGQDDLNKLKAIMDSI